MGRGETHHSEDDVPTSGRRLATSHMRPVASAPMRLLLAAVAGVSIITIVLAVQALHRAVKAHQAVTPVAGLVLVAVLWACSAGVYVARRRSADAYAKAWQRLSVFAGTAKEVPREITADGVGNAIARQGLYEVEPQPPTEHQADLLASVQDLISAGKLYSLYQPIVSLTDGAVIGAEALTRFTTDPVVTPDVWFGRATEVGLGVDLELLALSSALASADPLPNHIYLSINLSPDALADERTVALLQRGSWPCSQVVVEITEHVSVSDYATLAHAAATLRGLGVRIAVDDAGAGYASFRHILQLRPDYIKLDRALVDGLDHDAAKRALAGAFVAFGEELDALIVAEGVETAAELSAARSLGVHAAQGFHTGRPARPSRDWGG